MSLADPKIDQLTSLIRDSFRAREEHDPIYVDVGGHLGRIAAPQHQVIFGRRGSGKSCLLIHHLKNAPSTVFPLYINADEVKTLPYPDLLVRLILAIGEALPSSKRPWYKRILSRESPQLDGLLTELRELLDRAERSEVSTERSRGRDRAGEAAVGGGSIQVKAGVTASESERETSQFVQEKIATIERHLPDYKKALGEAIRWSEYSHAAIMIDDLYLIHQDLQPSVIDYLHRLLRGTKLYLKIGTVRHRTRLSKFNGQFIGVQLGQDIEEINLDQTFEHFDATRNYLSRMLDSMAGRVGLADFTETYFNPEGILHLTLASGGVPRDFLTIFTYAVEAARGANKLKWLTPTPIYKGASRVSYRDKLGNLRADVGSDAKGLERTYTDLTEFCLKDKRKTAFLIAQTESQAFKPEHELIQQLMDFKLIHVIEPDTSAASGREGRHEAYTLDFALFMEPRLRNIEHVEFWRVDDHRRRRGVREAPVNSLERARSALTQEPRTSPESTIEELTREIGIDEARGEDDD